MLKDNGSNASGYMTFRKDTWVSGEMFGFCRKCLAEGIGRCRNAMGFSQQALKSGL